MGALLTLLASIASSISLLLFQNGNSMTFQNGNNITMR